MKTVPLAIVIALASAACGAVDGPSAESPTPGGDLARELGILSRGTCRLDPLVEDAVPGCRALHPTPKGGVLVSDGLDAEAARAAFDGDVCRSWNSGGPAPRWIDEAI